MESIQSDVGQFDRTANMLGVGQGGQSGGLGGGGGVEGLAGFLQNRGDVRSGEAVANPESRQALDFGKGAENDDGTALLHPLDGGGRFGNEFVVRFVQDKEGAGREFFNKGFEFCVGNAGASGVVGRGEEDKANIIPDPGGEAGEVVVEIAIGHLFEGDTE